MAIAVSIDLFLWKLALFSADLCLHRAPFAQPLESIQIPAVVDAEEV
jgi:hypothetical protein